MLDLEKHATVGMGMLFEGEFDRAEAHFSMHCDTSPLHSLGLAYLSFMKAIITFEDDEIERAKVAFASTEALCTSQDDDLDETTPLPASPSTASLSSSSSSSSSASSSSSSSSSSTFSFAKRLWGSSQDSKSPPSGSAVQASNSVGDGDGDGDSAPASLGAQADNVRALAELKAFRLKVIRRSALGDANLLLGLVTIIQQESVMGFVKGGYLIRKSWKIYEHCQEKIDKMEGRLRDLRLPPTSAPPSAASSPSSSNPRKKFPFGDTSASEPSLPAEYYEDPYQLREIIGFGAGLFNVMLSLVPPNITKMISFLGFTGDRSKGLAQLWQSYSGGGFRAPFAALTLLWLFTVIGQFFAITKESARQGGVILSSNNSSSGSGAAQSSWSTAGAGLDAILPQDSLRRLDSLSVDEEHFTLAFVERLLTAQAKTSPRQLLDPAWIFRYPCSQVSQAEPSAYFQTPSPPSSFAPSPAKGVLIVGSATESSSSSLSSSSSAAGPGIAVESAILECQNIVRHCLSLYPRGSLFLFFNARILRVKGKLLEATVAFEAALEVEKQRALQQLCYYELGWCNMMMMNMAAASFWFTLLTQESKWSKAYYKYMAAICVGFEGNVPGAIGLMQEIPSLIRRAFAGKTIPVEKFVARRSSQLVASFAPQSAPAASSSLFSSFLGSGTSSALPLPKTPDSLVVRQLDFVLATVELIYIWCALPLMGRGLPFVLYHLKRHEKLCDDQELVLVNHLLQSAIYVAQKDDVSAYSLLNAILGWKQPLKRERHVLPFAAFDMAMLLRRRGEEAKCIQMLQSITKTYADFDFDNRLFTRIHAALNA